MEKAPPQIPVEKIEPQQEMIRQAKEYGPNKKRELTQFIFEYWRGDAHTHSQESSRNWGYAEGIYSEEEIMKYYQELGMEFVAFAEHASNPGRPEKLSADHEISRAFLNQIDRIEKLNQKGKFNIGAFSSTEANIFYDETGRPTIDLPKEVLQKLDLVVASRHAIDNEKDIKAIKESLLSAIHNPDVDVIGHPDRYIQLNQQVTDTDQPCSPEVYRQAWDEILYEMAKNGKAFEINFNNRPNDELLEIASQKGVKFMLNFDAHDFNQFKQGVLEGYEAKQKWAKGEAADEDLEVLRQYKLDRLTSGPGVRAILRLVKYLKKLKQLGVTPNRIINSSRENMINFLTVGRGKSTENLNLLKDKFLK